MSNKKKMAMQLGMPQGTAAHKLRKAIMFQMIQKLDLDWCFQCGNKIETIEELSVEHKIPWLDKENAKELFFDLDNIAFSHLKCNVSAKRNVQYLKIVPHGINGYKRGCRCPVCYVAKQKEKRIYLNKKKGI